MKVAVREAAPGKRRTRRGVFRLHNWGPAIHNPATPTLYMRRTRLLALLLDVGVCAAAADATGLALTALVWRYAPAAGGAIPWMWAALAGLAVAAFLLRDARGGRARRWLALEARLPDGRPPGAWVSIRRNLPLLIPLWNLYDAWPLTSDPEAPRRSDRAAGTRILRSS
jgi:hypothetical protein